LAFFVLFVLVVELFLGNKSSLDYLFLGLFVVWSRSFVPWELENNVILFMITCVATVACCWNDWWC